MDYRCPICGQEVRKRKLNQAIVTRMEIECPSCKGKVRLNVHPAETAIVLFNFAALVLLGALAYWFQSQGLVLLALVGAGLGSAALPVLERTYLRTWPRYGLIAKSPQP